jgi:VanZ family protein
MRHRCDRLRQPRLWQGIGWLGIFTVILLTLIPDPPSPPGYFLEWDKGQHIIAYAGLMWWFRQAFAAPTRWAILLIIMGVTLECLQGLSPYRTFEYGDMAANAIGVACGSLLASTPLGRTLIWVERRLFTPST